MIRDCELTRNQLDGVMIAEGRQVNVEGCLAEGNGGAEIAQKTWMEPNQGVVARNNVLRNNAVAGCGTVFSSFVPAVTLWDAFRNYRIEDHEEEREECVDVEIF